MKNNHYNLLAELQNSLRKLYEAFGFKPENVKLPIPSDLVMYIETLLNNGRISGYLESVISQIKSASKEADNMRLDIWNLKEESEFYKKRVSELEKQLESAPKTEEKVESANKFDAGIIKSIISLYDNQIIKLDFIKSQVPVEDSALRVAQSAIKEIETLLKNEGVEIINDKGEFSGKTQMIVDTKDTEMPELGGTVCDTVRVGFRYKDEILRAQEVIVYTHKEAE